jgi:hypothetical protein
MDGPPTGPARIVTASALWFPDFFVSKEDRQALQDEVEKATVGRTLLQSATNTDPDAIDSINNMLIDKPVLLPLAVKFLKQKIKDPDPRVSYIALDAVDLLMQKHGPPVQYEVMNRVLQRVLKMSIPTTRESTQEQALVRKRAGILFCFRVKLAILKTWSTLVSVAYSQMGCPQRERWPAC